MLEGLLKGKVALITGAARGIGKAIAMKLASAGADIAFTDLKEDDNFRNTVAEISALGVQCRGYASNAASRFRRISAISTFWSTTQASHVTA